MKAVVLLLCLLGGAFALQPMVSYEYDYEARIGTGFKVNNQYVASGLSAKVVVTNHGGEETYFKVTQVRLGEHTGSLVDLYEESLFKKKLQGAV